MNKKIMLLCAAGLIGAVANAQAVLVEKIEAQPGKLIIPYERYQLPNGLTLIVSEDHSDPVTYLNITYHVGSAREIPGKSGFAHFFEHMLFQGSQHVADEEHFKLIRQYGGEVNGNTTRDRTEYIETFPSNFTETALWMEADRMGFMLEAFTKKKFEVQRATVKNEKDQRQDVPYGFVDEVKDQNLYPPDHPYSWSTIGFVDDLDRADSNDLRNFFLRWYGPNNAAVIVCGDVNTKEVVGWVEKYYGSLNRCPDVKKQRVKQVLLTENKIKGYVDPNVYLPLLQTTYAGVPVGHEDEPALDLLTVLLSGSRKTPVYKKFLDMEDPYALRASFSNNPDGTFNHELAGEISYTILGYPWSDVKQLQNMMNQVIDSFEITGFEDDELARAKTGILSGFDFGIEDVSTKAEYLSTFWYLFDLKKANGESLNLQQVMDRYTAVTRDDIMRVYRKYLKGKFSTTVVIEPPAEGMEKEDLKKLKYVSFNPNATYKNPVAEAEYAHLVHKPVADNFDRNVRPEPKGSVTPRVPAIYRKKLSNGLEILGTEFSESPLTTITINMDGGRLLEGESGLPYGTARMMAASMNNGTATRTPKDLESELNKLAADISVSAGGTSLSVSLTCPSKNLDQALAILEEMMFKPRWDEKEFKKFKKNAKQGAINGLRSRTTGMANVWREMLWGNTQLGKYVGASEMEKVSLEDCKKYYADYFSPNSAKLVIVGSLKSEDVYKKLAFLDKWASKAYNVPKPMDFPKFETTQIFGVNYDDAEQSDILLGFRSLPFDITGEFFKNNIMNFALSGNFNSRLNLNLREDKGWTYGINGGFSSNYKDIPGAFAINAGIKAGATDSAIREIMEELERYRTSGMTKDEFNFTKSALLASEALNYENMFQKAGFIMGIAVRNLPEDYPQQQMAVLNAITIDELNKIAEKNLKTDEVVIVVAGDMLLLEKRLSELGYGKIQVLKADGSSKYKVLKATKKGTHDKNYK